MWFVYIIEADSGEFYTGITTDPERRFLEHRDNRQLGAKFFRSRKPIKIIYLEEVLNRSVATKRERQIKKMKKKDKVNLALNSLL